MKTSCLNTHTYLQHVNIPTYKHTHIYTIYIHTVFVKVIPASPINFFVLFNGICEYKGEKQDDASSNSFSHTIYMEVGEG